MSGSDTNHDDSGGVSRRDSVRGIGATGAVSVSGVAGCIGGDVGGGPDAYTIAALVPESGEFSDVGQDMRQG